MTRTSLIAILLLICSTLAHSQGKYVLTDKGCKAQGPKGLEHSNLLWSGDCRGEFAEGIGVLRSQDCTGNRCIYFATVGLFRTGVPSGMLLGYFGRTEARNDELYILFYDSSMNEVEEYTSKKNRTPVNMRSYEYIFPASSIVRKSRNPRIAEGLTLDEVLLLFERWNSDPDSGPPRDIASATQGTSQTANYYRAQDATMAERDRQFSEWKQRRDSRREERARMEAEQQAQNLAFAQRQQADLEQARRRQEDSARRQAEAAKQTGAAASLGTYSCRPGMMIPAEMEEYCARQSGAVAIQNPQNTPRPVALPAPVSIADSRPSTSFTRSPAGNSELSAAPDGPERILHPSTKQPCVTQVSKELSSTGKTEYFKFQNVCDSIFQVDIIDPTGQGHGNAISRGSLGKPSTYTIFCAVEERCGEGRWTYKSFR